MRLKLRKSIVLLGLAGVVASPADLLVYEPFLYPVGNNVLTPLNGGLGFSGAWARTEEGFNDSITVYAGAPGTGSTNTTVATPGNLDGIFNNVAVATGPGGNRNRYIDGASGDDRLTALRRLSQSAGALAGADKTLWASVIWTTNGQTSFGRQVGFVLGTDGLRNRSQNVSTNTVWGGSGAGDAMGVGGAINTAAVTPAIWDGGNVAVRTTVGAKNVSTSVDNIVILKFVFADGTDPDTVSAWAFGENETVSLAAFDANAISASAVVDQNTLDILSFGQSQVGVEAIDEIRIGDTFADVISLPPPGPVDVAASSVQASPAFVNADGISPATVTVSLTDNLGVPVAGKDVTLANTAGPQLASIDPQTAVTTDANGQAAFAVTSTTVGTEVFTATNTTDTLVLTQTASVEFQPSADAGLSTLAATRGTVVADGVVTSAITVTLNDSTGNPVAGKNVTLEGSPGNASISPASALTDAGGQVTFTVRSTTTGTVVFTATSTTDDVVVTQTVSVLFVAPDSPGLLVYEGFDYGVLSDVTTPLAGGIGFLNASAWAPGQEGGTITVYDENGNWDGVVANLPTSPGLGSRYIGGATGDTRITAQRVLSQSAGALAGADKVLWASIVWKMDGNNFGRQVGFVLGTDGISNRSQNIDTTGSFGSGAGDAIGVGGAINTLAVTPTIWDAGIVAARTTAGAANVSTTLDNLVILKFVFADGGEKDAVYAYRFDENQALTESSFNSSAVFAESVIDQDTLNILSFGQSKVGVEAIDEIRLGNSFGDVISLPPGWITSFESAGATRVIDQGAKTIALKVPFGTDLATLAPTFTLSSGVANQTSGAPPSPTFAVQNPVTYTVTDDSTDPDTVSNYTVTVSVENAQGPDYNSWSGGLGPDIDSNGDSVFNGVAWVLGAASPAVNAVGLLPTLDNTSDPDFFIFNYRRSDDAEADGNTAMKVQYGSTLAGWADADPLVSPGEIVITPFDDFYDTDIDKVEVKIRRTLAVNGRLFARLLVTVTTP